MSNVHYGPNHAFGHEPVATLVRSIPIRLVEISRGGCRLECATRVESGISGMLAVELAGLLRVDDIRIARCQPRIGAGAVYQIGVELLRTRRLGRRTVRMAVRRIISGEHGVGQTQETTGDRRHSEVSNREEESASGSRAPPAHLSRGP